MKNTTILKYSLVAALFGALAGCASAPKNYELPVDKDGKYADPNAYYSYGPAMKHTAEAPLGSFWQKENKAKLEAATRPETLAAFTASPAAAEALLAKVGPAYTTDPVVLTQIAAVTQKVMCPKCPKAPAARKVWVAALEKALGGAADDYRRAFYRDQLRWCGYRSK